MSRTIRTISALALAGCLTLPLAPADARTPTASTYTNAASQSFADTYADPAVIQGKDGWWYAYATADPLKAGDPSTVGHIARTKDWSRWEYVGPIFTGANRPAWATSTSFLWAPDVRYINGRYVMYFTVTDTTLNADGWDPAIGVATAPSPAGPWTPTDEPIVAPRPAGDGRFVNTIDPAGFTDRDGNNYLYFGNYFGGAHVVELDAEGLRTTSSPKLVGAWDRYEGSYVVEHDGWYYLMASSANCCAGPTTGYSVFAGRSRSPMGPFLDKDGLDLAASVTGGTLVVTQNGNKWVGAGHNAMMTDASGRDFLVYHAIDRNVPWLTEPFGINRRPMLIDPVDWVDGWPRVNAGSGPSETAMPLPTTTSLLGGDPADPSSVLVRSQAASDAQGGQVARVRGLASSVALPAGDIRVRLDVKTDEPLKVSIGAKRDQVKVTIDPHEGQLSLHAAGRTAADVLPQISGWQTLTIEVTGGEVLASLSSSDLADPHAVARVASPVQLPAAPLRLNGQALVDNLTVARPATDATELIPQPAPTTDLFRDDFNGSLGAGWEWVRPDADITVGDSTLQWPVKNVDLAGGTNSGALLLRDAPDGDWIAETRFTLDLGVDTKDRNHQQAGLVIHNNDDDFARLGSVSIWGTRTVEYAREMVATEDGRTSFGGAIVGANDPTMHLRIAHHRNASGERLFRSAISRDDGKTWVWGATWTFPADATPRVGLYAGGGAQPAAVASFDWFRISESTAPDGTWPR